jgi:tetratricopeptide (TPR) repeat protein
MKGEAKMDFLRDLFGKSNQRSKKLTTATITPVTNRQRSAEVTVKSKFWKCSQCGSTLEKQRGAAMAVFEAGGSLEGTATCRVCGAKHSLHDVYAGKFDVAVTQEKATDVWEEPASEAANLLVRRNRNVEISEEHIKNKNAGKEIAKKYFDQSFEYWEKSNYQEALEECDKAIELAPDWSEAHNLRGVILEEMDKPDESIMEYREAIRLDPDNKDAKKNLAYIDPVEAAIAARRTATTSITNCPRCKARVIPKPDGTCPSCQSIIRSGRSSSPSLYIAQDSRKHARPHASNANHWASQKEKEMEYFADEMLKGDGLCSDNACPCPQVGIPRGTGYLFIEESLVEFRRQYPTLESAKRAMQQMQEQRLRAIYGETSGGVYIYRTGPILVCEQGAKLRNLDLEVAMADAKHWWETGQVPLRATPLVSNNPKDATGTPMAAPSSPSAQVITEKKSTTRGTTTPRK